MLEQLRRAQISATTQNALGRQSCQSFTIFGLMDEECETNSV